VSLRAPGDGSEAFVGGAGLDAIIFRFHRSRRGCRSVNRCSAADPSIRCCGVSTGHTHSGREWSGKLLHIGGEPLARL
jgi:hypothetical protein